MKKYVRIYWQVLKQTIQASMEYRTNFLIRSIHSLVYSGAFLVILLVLYQHSSTIAGWSKDEAILLFGVLHFVYGATALFFVKGVENMLARLVRTGDFDFYLTKPVSAQFMALTDKPWIDSIVFNFIMLAIVIRQLIILWPQISWFGLVSFLIAVTLCVIIVLLALSILAAAAFFVDHGRQLFYFFEKASDFSQYPLEVFPSSIQFILVSVVPIAFFAYVPTSILLERRAWLMWTLILIALPVFYLINRWIWKKGLQNYSSASS